MLQFRDEAFHRYFTHPRYLELVQRKFGDKVLAHVEDMTRIRLKRQLYQAAPVGAAA